ncbi:hypothetical protein M9H77_05054 [Catharanthus roseus]|uniref:Uncharacterized protein n=1 Tax=Catharanthus roseus TaxID=4058 RepID=A0ACC0CFV6_CATRO|nr:hypothetical protein M9H77_05054 [Catharanthus roseus]
MLFWNFEIARDAYGPYFTGVVHKSWTLPTNRMISHDELIKKILKYRDMDPNLWNNEQRRKMRYLWTIPPHLAKEGINILVAFEHIQ